MKFGAQFEANIVAEWAEHYCRYKHLKHLIGRLFPQRLKKSKNKKDKKKDTKNYGSADRSDRSADNDRKRTSDEHNNDSIDEKGIDEKDIAGDGEGDEHDEQNGDGRAEYIINYQSDDIADRATYFGAPSAPLKSAEERRAEIMDELAAELDKVDRWYTVVERELVKNYEALKSQIESLADAHSSMAPLPDPLSNAANAADVDIERYGSEGSGVADVATSSGVAMDRLTSDDETGGALSDPGGPIHDRSLPMAPMGASLQSQNRSIITTGTGAAAAALVSSVPSAHFTREAHDLKNACIRLLRKADRLVNFVAMNTTAFEKLVKNFQKRSDFNVKDEFLADMRARDFVKSHEIDENLIPATFDLFVRHFEGGNVEQAHITLLAKIPQVKEYSRTDAYVFGFKCGAIAILAIWIFLHVIDPLRDPTLTPAARAAAKEAWQQSQRGHGWDIDLEATYPVFRVTGLAILAVWLWGALVYLWSKYRVSYVFLFEFNPRTRLTHFQIFEEAANMSIFYLLNVLLFLSHHELYLGHHVPRAIYPLTIFMFLLLKLIVPFAPFAHWATRWSLLESLWNIAKAPFGRIRFRDEFIAEFLTSLCKLIVDFQLTFCFYFIETPFGGSCSSSAVWTIPVMCALPFWWRMAQCIRIARDDPKRRLGSLVNACKYSLAIGVIIMGAVHPHAASLFSHGHPFRVSWVLLNIITTVAFFIWDVVVDWGLFSFDTDSTSPLLRTQLMFHRPLYYYIAIVLNFVLRFVWVITIIPFPWQSLPVLRRWQRLYGIPVIVTIELVRRMIWGLITVENYHLQHSARLRNSRIMPVLFDQNNPDTDFKRRANTVTGYNGVIEGLLLLAIIFVADVLGQMIAT